MSVNLIRYMIASAEACTMVFSLVCNLVVMVAMVRGRMISASANAIYIIAFFNMAVGTSQVFIHMCYSIPSTFTMNWLLPQGADGWAMSMMSSYYLGNWYITSILQFFMALNRVCAVCFPHNVIFTHRNVKIMLATIYTIGMTASTITENLSPCCRLIPDWRTFSYSYSLPGNVAGPLTFNYSQLFFDYPLEVLSTSTCICSYACILYYIKSMRKKVTSAGATRSSAKEIRHCAQCVFICLFYVITWLSFHLMPRMGFTTYEPFAITQFALIIDAGSNALIYLLSSKEVRFQVKHMWQSEKHPAMHPLDGIAAVPQKHLPEKEEHSRESGCG